MKNKKYTYQVTYQYTIGGYLRIGEFTTVANSIIGVADVALKQIAKRAADKNNLYDRYSTAVTQIKLIGECV